MATLKYSRQRESIQEFLKIRMIIRLLIRIYHIPSYLSEYQPGYCLSQSFPAGQSVKSAKSPPATDLTVLTAICTPLPLCLHQLPQCNGPGHGSIGYTKDSPVKILTEKSTVILQTFTAL